MGKHLETGARTCHSCGGSGKSAGKRGAENINQKRRQPLLDSLRGVAMLHRRRRMEPLEGSRSHVSHRTSHLTRGEGEEGVVGIGSLDKVREKGTIKKQKEEGIGGLKAWGGRRARSSSKKWGERTRRYAKQTIAGKKEASIGGKRKRGGERESRGIIS